MAERARFCRRCGKPLDRAWTGRPRVYCSGECRTAAWREKREDGPAVAARPDPLASDLSEISFRYIADIGPKPEPPEWYWNFVLYGSYAEVRQGHEEEAREYERQAERYEAALADWERRGKLGEAARAAREWQRALNRAETPLLALHCICQANQVAVSFDQAGDQERADDWRARADALAGRICIGTLRPNERASDLAGYVLASLS